MALPLIAAAALGGGALSAFGAKQSQNAIKKAGAQQDALFREAETRGREDLTGGRDDAINAFTAARTGATGAYDTARTGAGADITLARDRSLGSYDGIREGAEGGYNLFRDAIGANGFGRMGETMEGFLQNNPLLTARTGWLQDRARAAAAAVGRSNSGATDEAMARIASSEGMGAFSQMLPYWQGEAGAWRGGADKVAGTWGDWGKASASNQLHWGDNTGQAWRGWGENTGGAHMTTGNNLAQLRASSAAARGNAIGATAAGVEANNPFNAFAQSATAAAKTAAGFKLA